MITVALVGILLAIAVPAYRSLANVFRLKGAVAQIAGDLTWARMRAVQKGNSYRVFFFDDHTYEILDDADNDGTADAGEWKLPRDLADQYAGVALTANNNPIFRPRGTASNLATIELTNPSGSRTITIGITGRIKVQ